MSLMHILTRDLKVSAFFLALCSSLPGSVTVLSQQCYLSISGDASEDAVSKPPSSKQAAHMDIASKKQAEPSSSKQAVRRSAANKKQAEPSSSKQAVRVSAASKKQAEPSSSKKAVADVDVAEIMKLCASHMQSSVEKIEDTWLQRVNTEHTLQRSYKVSVSCCAMQPRTPMSMMSTMLLQSISKEEQARRMKLEARLQELSNTTHTITADRDHLKADRDTQRQTEATLMERLRMAEAMAHTNEQAIVCGPGQQVDKHQLLKYTRNTRLTRTRLRFRFRRSTLLRPRPHKHVQLAPKAHRHPVPATTPAFSRHI